MMDASSTNLKLEAAGFGLGPFLDSNQTRHDKDIAEKWLLDDVLQPPDEGPLSKSKPLFALSKSNPLNGLSDHTYRALQYLARDRDDFWALYECWVEKGQASLTAGFKTKKELKEAVQNYKQWLGCNKPQADAAKQRELRDQANMALKMIEKCPISRSNGKGSIGEQITRLERERDVADSAYQVLEKKIKVDPKGLLEEAERKAGYEFGKYKASVAPKKASAQTAQATPTGIKKKRVKTTNPLDHILKTAMWNGGKA